AAALLAEDSGGRTTLLIAMAGLRAIPLQGMPEILPGADVADCILSGLRRNRVSLKAGDIIVVKHKIISKAEGQIVALASVKPSSAARRWARQHHLDPRMVHLALTESRRVVRRRRGILITETRHGLLCANNGVDLSNVDGGQSA